MTFKPGDVVEIRGANTLHSSWHGARGVVSRLGELFVWVNLGRRGQLPLLAPELIHARPFQRVDAGPVTL